MADEASYSNVCRDARLVRPLAKPRIYACILNGTNARTVRPYIPLARKSSCHSPNPKVQYSKFNVQSQQILKFNIQSSKFKVQAPTSPAWPFCRATCPEWFCNLHGITRQIILFFYHIGLAIGKF